jgi:hypothetical protein
MADHKCAFSHPLIAGQFGCENAEQVTRRGGPDIACRSDAAHTRCEQLFQRMKAAALPAFGFEDDLLSMPHSVLVKVQYGGLLGLQRSLGAAEAEAAEVKNIHALVGRAVQAHGSLEAVPYPAFVDAMTSFVLKRRR